jgi:sulfide:quinone oxidoreductase
MKTVLVLGGGSGGLVVANKLRKRLPRQDRVVLIDRERDHLFAPSLLWLSIGDREANQIQRPLDRLERKGIEVIHGEIERLDPAARSVVVSGRELTGDAVVISLGAALAPELVPGLSSAGHNLYTLDGALGIRETLRRFHGGRVVILTAAPAYKCPAAPYEAAMLVEYDLRRHGLRDRSEIAVYAAEPGPMGTAGPQVSGAVTQMLSQKGIKYHPSHQVQSVDPHERRIRFQNGSEASYDHLVYVPPHRAPLVVKEAGLCGESGWVTTDRATLRTAFPAVYALGDVVSIPLAMGKPLPKAGVFAHYQAEVVAENIASQFEGRPESACFNGHGECFLEVGDGRAGLGHGNFYGEPTPQVKMRPPSRWLHLGKVLFEKNWLRQWF